MITKEDGLTGRREARTDCVNHYKLLYRYININYYIVNKNKACSNFLVRTVQPIIIIIIIIITRLSSTVQGMKVLLMKTSRTRGSAGDLNGGLFL